MRRGLAVFVSVAALLPAQDPDTLIGVQAALQRATARVAPSVVRIETFGGVRRDPSAPASPIADGAQPDKQPPKGGGAEPKKPARPAPDKKPQLVTPGFLAAQGATTGLVLSADGWIVVSRFALASEPTTILVTLADGRALPAVRKGEDTSRGIALLKVEAEGLAVAPLADPAEVRVGQWVAALGRTFGVGQPSVHLGIVSATNRIFGRAIQVDANTSPANYGGPVIDLDGRVLGIAAPLSPQGREAGADWYDSGIGFATTLGDIAPLLARMQQGEVLHRAWLGVATDPKFAGPGARLLTVAPNSAAAGVGLKAKDVIQEVDGVPVRHHFHLQMLIAKFLAGDSAHLVIRRGDETLRVTVFLSVLPDAERQAEKKGRVDDPLPWEPPPSGGRRP